MSVCTMNRFAAIQDWPLFCTRAVTAVLTASSRSTDGITMNGSLPPSSITAGLISSPQMAATDWPAGSLPGGGAAAAGGAGRWAGRFAAGEGGRRDARITQDALDDAGRNEQRLEATLREAAA